ncbi:hypothetical protein M758_3G216600 [Ceratodon purpureus]|nr:hypothetical protein M758_3G216600 [Ceratodon purpureus]
MLRQCPQPSPKSHCESERESPERVSLSPRAERERACAASPHLVVVWGLVVGRKEPNTTASRSISSHATPPYYRNIANLLLYFPIPDASSPNRPHCLSGTRETPLDSTPLDSTPRTGPDWTRRWIDHKLRSGCIEDHSVAFYRNMATQ